MTAAAVVASVLAWGAAGGLAYAGAAQGLRNVSSLSQLVGAYHLSPDPVGPPVTGYDGAVIGDSRATRVGGPPVAVGSPDDVACERSIDSLAAEIGDLLPARVLNLACPSATITSGLRGPQEARGRPRCPRRSACSNSVGTCGSSVVAIGRTMWAGSTSCATATASPLLPTSSARASSTTGWRRSTASTVTARRPQRPAGSAPGDRHDLVRGVRARRRLPAPAPPASPAGPSKIAGCRPATTSSTPC